MPVEKGSSIVKLSLPSVSLGSGKGSNRVPDVEGRLSHLLMDTGRVCRDLVRHCFFRTISKAGKHYLSSDY
jgi:hypothetical protein